DSGGATPGRDGGTPGRDAAGTAGPHTGEHPAADTGRPDTGRPDADRSDERRPDESRPDAHQGDGRPDTGHPDDGHAGDRSDPVPPGTRDAVRRPYGESPLHRFVDGVQRRFREAFTADGREERAYRQNVTEQQARIAAESGHRPIQLDDGRQMRVRDVAGYVAEHQHQAQERFHRADLADQQESGHRAEATRLAGEAARLRSRADDLHPQDPWAQHLRDEAARADHGANLHRADADAARTHADDERRAGAAHRARADDAARKRDWVTQDLQRTLGARAWHLVNDEHLGLVGDEDGPSRSALTGGDVPPAGHRSRRYDHPGGLRRPLAQHQRRLEARWPRDRDGNFQRHPRLTERLVSRINAFGRRDDPTRSMNCNDTVASFFDGWTHGRPTVAAPRTFDGYSGGEPRHAFAGEQGGPGRIEDLTGGRYQSLVDDASQQSPQDRAATARAGFDRIRDQLLTAGPGSFASIVTAWHASGAHAWAMVNDGGTVRYVDVQTGRLADTLDGLFAPHVIDSVDALVVDGNGHPVPFDDAPGGRYGARPLTPEYQRQVPVGDRTAVEAHISHERAVHHRDWASRQRIESGHQWREAQRHGVVAADLRRTEQHATDDRDEAEREHSAAADAADRFGVAAAQHERAARAHEERAQDPNLSQRERDEARATGEQHRAMAARSAKEAEAARHAAAGYDQQRQRAEVA
ncbi:MAG: toxin glutamine deamidase domain-containing protein, partial [Actinocatenispora sp.]